MKVRRKRYGWSLIFLAVTFVLLGIWLTREYSLHDLWELMQEVRLRWLAAATGLMVVYWLLEAAGLHRAIRKVVPTQRLADTLCTTMIGQFFNCITPFSSGGQPMQALHLVKTGVPLSLASCSLMIKFIVYQFILTVYSAVTLLWCFPRMAGRISAIGWLALVGFGVNILVIVGLICLGFFRKPTERFLYGIVKLIRRIGLLTPEQEEAAPVLRVTIWPEPFCFEKTPDEKKTVKDFAYTEDGLDEAYDWICQSYDDRIAEWKEARDNPYKGLF